LPPSWVVFSWLFPLGFFLPPRPVPDVVHLPFRKTDQDITIFRFLFPRPLRPRAGNLSGLRGSVVSIFGVFSLLMFFLPLSCFSLFFLLLNSLFLPVLSLLLLPWLPAPPSFQFFLIVNVPISISFAPCLPPSGPVLVFASLP